MYTRGRSGGFFFGHASAFGGAFKHIAYKCDSVIHGFAAHIKYFYIHTTGSGDLDNTTPHRARAQNANTIVAALWIRWHYSLFLCSILFGCIRQIYGTMTPKYRSRSVAAKP